MPIEGGGASGTISFGASTGAASGFDTGCGATLGCAAAGAGGGGGGGGGGVPTNAIIVGGVGSTSVAIRGMMMTAPNRMICARMETGTVYHDRDPTFVVGLTTSPNNSRGTASPLLLLERGASPRIIVRPKKQCQRITFVR
jgi:hypothetical protein